MRAFFEFSHNLKNRLVRLGIAFYKDEWFKGNNVKTALQQMTTDNGTIILEKRVA